MSNPRGPLNDPYPTHEVDRKVLFVFETNVFGTQAQVFKSREDIEEKLRVILHKPDLELKIENYEYEDPEQLGLDLDA